MNTPITDAFAIKFKTTCGEKYWVPVDISRNLERERDELKAMLTKEQGAVTISRNGYVQELERQRDELQKAVNGLCEHFNVSPANTTLLAVELLKIERERDEARILEAMYQKVVAACLRCDLIPACEREDDQLEPPWEVIDRIRCERDEARGQRDRLAELRNKNAIHFNELLELCGTLRKERNRLAKALRECREDSYELLAERDWWKNETRIGYQERYKVTLANTERATEALQSLTPNASRLASADPESPNP